MSGAMLKDHMHPIKQYCKDHHMLIRDFAIMVGRTSGYISQIIMGVRNPSAKLCVEIELATDGEIPKETLIFFGISQRAA
jgi:hypothetical protein